MTQEGWFQFTALPKTSCVSLEKSLGHPVAKFPYCEIQIMLPLSGLFRLLNAFGQGLADTMVIYCT